MANTEVPIGRGDSVTPGQAKTYPITRPVPAAKQMLGMSIDKTGWVDADATLTLTLEASLDNGKTWQHWCSLTARGGLDGADALAVSPPPAKALLRMISTSSGKAVRRPVAFLEVR